MRARFAILCPGQGAQHAGMFDLVRNDPQGVQVLADLDLDSRLFLPLGTILHDDSLLFANRYAQPLIVAAGLATWEVLRRELPQPTVIAGYSIGELTAYGVAGALSPLDAIELAQSRARAMDTAQIRQPEQGMMSVSGVSIQELAQQMKGLEAWIAIETGFDTAIIGGTLESLRRLQESVQLAGARTTMLPVGIASHTPLMMEAVARFEHALTPVGFHDPAIPVVAGISGQVIREKTTAIATLTQQIDHPLRWQSCMDTCAEQGVTVALELGPGAALARMLRERHPEIECRSLADFRSLAGALHWLRNRVA